MTKPNRVQKRKNIQPARRPSRTLRPGRSKVSSNPPAKSSKQVKVLRLLGRPGGATVADIVKATGWQPHTVRGFLAATVRRKLKLDLSSEKIEGKRVYRISDGTGAN